MSVLDVDCGELRSIARLYDGLAADLGVVPGPDAPDAGESSALVAQALVQVERATVGLARDLHATAQRIDGAVEAYEGTDSIQSGALRGIGSAAW